jgi:hypothetical protein
MVIHVYDLLRLALFRCRGTLCPTALAETVLWGPFVRANNKTAG